MATSKKTVLPELDAALAQVPTFSREKIAEIRELFLALTRLIGDMMPLTGAEAIDDATPDRSHTDHSVLQPPQLFWRLAPDGHVIDSNQSALTELGLIHHTSNSDFLWELPYWDIAPGQRQKLRNSLEQTGTGAISCLEVTCSAKTGTVSLILTIVPIVDSSGSTIQLNVLGRDISEQKKIERKLRFIQFAFDTTIDQALWTQKDGRFFYVNEASCQALGYSEAELLQMTVPEINPHISPAEFARLWQIWHKEGKSRFETEHITKDGRIFPVEVRTNTVVFDGEEYICAFATDISERKQMEKALRKNERMLRTLFQSLPDLIWLKDPDGVYITCNHKFEQFCGHKEEELVGKTDYDIVDKEQADAFRRYDQAAIAKGAPSYNEEWVTFASSGEKALVEVVKTPMYDNQGQLIGVLGVSRDITQKHLNEKERAKLEDQLQQAQKMEAIGRLAGGVAHDFNNMLGAIIGDVDLLRLQTSPDSPLHADLTRILNAAERSSALTRQLLGFARKQIISPVFLDLNETVAGLLMMLRRLIGEEIELIWKPGDVLQQIFIDPTQIDQILVNLCLNARDAINGSGVITIATANTTLDTTYCEQHVDSIPGDYVSLSITDTGEGINNEIRANIFEPFFTTKKDIGTGLGLATVYGIVKQNEGSIDVTSTMGQGSCFRIFLPVKKSEQRQPQKVAEAEQLQPGNETILLVEDEPFLLEIVPKMLDHLGYRVLVVSTPEAALELVGSAPPKIDLLITDVVMPRMNGHELADQILTTLPTVKVLYMSGYTADIIAQHGVLGEGLHFIKKPFAVTTLASKIRAALEDR